MVKSNSMFRRVASTVMAVLIVLSTIVVMDTSLVSAATKKYVTSIKTSAKSVTVEAGKTKNVKITVKVAKNASKKFTVKSSNTKVATAKVSGSYVKITAKSSASDKAKATVTVTTKDKGKKGKKLSASIKVTVKKPLKSISLKSSDSEITVGETAKLTVASKTKGAKIQKTVFSSSDNDVAIVDERGTVTGLKASASPVVITAVSTDYYGNKAKASVKITVKDTEAPKLEKIKLTANPDTISVGSTSTLTVVSDTDGVEIARVEYRSDNDYIATVNSGGIVSGQHSGVAPIIVTAYDANGNSATATISITVNELISATITGVEKSAALFVGETKILNPVAVDTEPNFSYVSDNEKVATVSSAGVITALSEGTATITVRIVGTNASAVCVVTVKDNAPGIESFRATHADVLTVKLTAPVAQSDRDKINVKLTKGTIAMKPEIRWSDDGSYIYLSNDSELEATSYNILISSNDVSLDINKNTAGCTVEPRAVKGVRIKTVRVPKADNVKIYFDALDNYDDPVADIAANRFNWVISSSEASVKIEDITNQMEISHVGYLLLNLKNISNLVPDRTSLTFKAEWKDNPREINTISKVDVVSLNVQSIKLSGFVQSEIFESSKAQPYTLKYEAKDQYGDDIDWSLYKEKAYNNTFTAYSSNDSLVSAPTVYDGKLVVYVEPNQNGKATISVTGNDLKTSYVDIEVLPAPKPVRIKFDEELTLIAGDDEDKRVPVTFVDQYGNDMTTGSVSVSVFNDTFATPRMSSPGLLVEYRVMENRSYLVFNAKNLTSRGNITVSYSTYSDNNELINSPYTVTVNELRRASTIKLITTPETEMVIGQTCRFRFEILDNHGARWTGGNVIVELETSNHHYIEADYVMVNDTGLGEMAITASNKSDGVVDDVVVTFRMYDADNFVEGSNENVPIYSLGTEYHVKVYDNFNEIKTTTNYVKDTEIKSGQTIQITLELYNEGNLLTSYNRSYSKVAIREGFVEKTDDGYETTFYSDIQYVDISFVNGKATFNVQTNKAGDIEFMGLLPAIGKDDDVMFNTSVIEPIKVVAGDVVKYDIKFIVTDDEVYMAVFALDTNNNVKTDYVPTDSTYITLSSPTGTYKPSDYIYGVDSINGYIPADFSGGYAVFRLKDYIPNGATVTVKNGNISGSCLID